MTARTIRDQVPVLERLGLSAVEARMAIVPRLWAGSRAELDEAWRLPAGMYRDRRVAESCGFWQGFWSNLRVHMEAGEHFQAVELLDRAIARVEPWPSDDAGTRGRREWGPGDERSGAATLPRAQERLRHVGPPAGCVHQEHHEGKPGTGPLLASARKPAP